MSGVWVFKNGVVRLEGNDARIPKVLVHIPSNEVITSYSKLETHLSALGWERCDDDPTILQFRKEATNELKISLPTDFSAFKSQHMYDVVIKNRNDFEVRDMQFK